MAAKRAQLPFRDELPRLLRDNGISGRELAKQVGIDQSYVSLVLNGQRAPSRKLLERSAEALGLPAAYWREFREQVVLERIRADAALLERVYALVDAAPK